VLADLSSTNGTVVNGTKIVGEHRLVDGDEIAIGTARIRFDAG
jgi:pSer/pThr/pTyr-binding forkhead associated (FHA) protein